MKGWRLSGRHCKLPTRCVISGAIHTFAFREVRLPQSLESALAYSERWIDIIHKTEISEEEGKLIIEESKQNFAEHFNKGWLEYRKSVTEAGDWAATEWTGSGALFRDVLGREYIDCLGAYRSEEHTSELQSPTNLVC